MNKGELLFPEEEFGKRSEPRNRLLADLLSRTEYMEKAGTGIKRIIEACRINGNAVNFFFSDAFRVEMLSINKIDNVTDRQKKILLLIKHNKNVTTKEIAEQLGLSRRTILRELDEMKHKNFIKRIGKERSGHWESGI